MRRKDFRGIGRDTQEALRARAVFLVLTVRKSQAEAAEAAGVSRQTVNQWLKRHAKTGEDGLRDGRRVSARKGKGKLTAAEAVRVVIDGAPRNCEVVRCAIAAADRVLIPVQPSGADFQGEPGNGRSGEESACIQDNAEVRVRGITEDQSDDTWP
jgi:transposase-like protein